MHPTMYPKNQKVYMSFDLKKVDFSLWTCFHSIAVQCNDLKPKCGDLIKMMARSIKMRSKCDDLSPGRGYFANPV